MVLEKYNCKTGLDTQKWIEKCYDKRANKFKFS